MTRGSPRRRALLRLATVAAATWAVAAAAVFTEPQAGLITAGALLASVIAASIALRRRGGTAVIIAVALAAACAAAGSVWISHPERSVLAAHTGVIRGSVTVTGSVAPAWPGAWRFAGRILGEDGEVGDVVVLFTGDRDAALDVGASVEVRGTTTPARAGERAVLRIRAAAVPVIERSPDGIWAVASALRRGLAESSSAFPGAGAQLLPGLAVGDTTAVTDDLDAAMKTSGLSHLTAVSGSNCAIVVGAAFVVAAVCRAPRWVRVLTAVVVLGGFVVLVTPEPSVVRAAAMSSTAMLAVLTGRSRTGAGILATSVTVLLWVDPWLSTSVGFMLSVAATAALLLLAGPVARRLARVMPVSVAMVIAVPLAAQLACAPILVMLAPSVSVWAVAANILAAPAAPIATVLGLVACLGAAVPVLGTALTALAWPAAQWIGSTATLFAGMPVATVAWWDGVGGALALAVVCAAIVVAVVGSTRRAIRVGALAILMLTCALASGLWAVRSIVVPLTTPGDWRMAVCDVGQGDAVVLRGAGGIMLVDTGPDPTLVGECLDRLRVDRIGVLVLTHFDADHAGGLRAIEGRVDVVIHGPPGESDHQRALERLALAGAELVPARPGLAVSVGDAAARVVWPPSGEPAGNDASVVVEWEAGGVRAVLLGDLSADAQQRLLATHALRPPYSVVKVAHHGSADQWPRLYAALGAPLAVIPVGIDNDYAHPRPQALAMLDGLGATIARTDVSGLLLVSSDRDAVRLWRERPPP